MKTTKRVTVMTCLTIVGQVDVEVTYDDTIVDSDLDCRTEGVTGLKANSIQMMGGEDYIGKVEEFAVKNFAVQTLVTAAHKIVDEQANKMRGGDAQLTPTDLFGGSNTPGRG